MSSSQTVRKRLASLKLREQQEQERDKQRKREAEERSQEIAELEQREREEEENRRKAVEEEERRRKAKEAERRKEEIELAQLASLVSETRSMKQKRTVTLGEPLPMGACDRCIAGNQTRKKGCTISQASAKKKAVQLQKVASTSDEAEEDGEEEEEEEEEFPRQRKMGKVEAPRLGGDSISVEVLRNLMSTMQRMADIQDRQLVVLEDLACTQRTLQLLAGDDPRWRRLSELEPKDRNLHHVSNILRNRKRKRPDGKSTLEDHWRKGATDGGGCGDRVVDSSGDEASGRKRRARQ
ncbi:hypothetical protein M378DRAFT_28707 [Amanita muscaria Koide BX008]|uniref:Uncharacterized protein n=1 Tax=Amanita muscaria (strain Koide BX008) TaxID=946122 RepID=A0A0C2W0E8_AMAMK|nr:hypothetical protein M378DRAFT_28707 [Amanita muscaria Koide BX008]